MSKTMRYRGLLPLETKVRIKYWAKPFPLQSGIVIGHNRTAGRNIVKTSTDKLGVYPDIDLEVLTN